jgi:hypothetical protein
MNFCTKTFFCLLLLVSIGCIQSFGTTRTSATNGNWNSATTWTPNGIPAPMDDIVIANGITITVTSNQTAHNVTVNSGGLLKWSGAYKLSVSGSLTVNGTVDMTGDLALTTVGTPFILGPGSSFTWKPTDNTLAGASLFTNGTESFALTSTLIIQRWYDYTVPLASSMTGDYGNLELNSLSNGNIYEWNQNNLLETHKIRGTLTIDQGWITLDKSGRINNITIGNIILKNANSSFYGHNGTHPGSFTITTSSVTNNGGIFYGLNDGDGNINLHVTGDFTTLGNTKIITNSGMTNVANGNATFLVDGTFTQSGGDTRILYNITTTNSGVFSATFNKLTLDGGIFMAQTACRTSIGACTLNVTNDFNVTFSSPADKFRTTSLSSINSSMNNVEVNLNVGGSLHLSGHAVSEFTSTASAGTETVNIHGDLTVNGTDASFNYGTIQASHDNTLTVDGNITVNNGSMYFSRNNGSTTINSNGNFTFNSGTVSLKGGTGSAVFNQVNNYSQSGGTFYIHNNTTTPATSSCIMDVAGNFSQSGGVFNFDNNTSYQSATHSLNIKGSSYNITGGTMTHAGAGSCIVFGQLNFASTGNVQFNRTGNAHMITQVKQCVLDRCSVTVQGGNIQIASHQTPATDYLKVATGGTLELKSLAHIFSNGLFTNSGMQVDSAGVLATQHTSGMYNGTPNSAINAGNNMNYFLHPFSVVEYNGSFPQLVTGIGVGNATGDQHKYGILKINSNGAIPKSVSLAMANICVRTQLQLMKGELNLNSQTLTIENGNTNAIIRSTGYIRSEFSTCGFICWKNISAGTHTFPFGVSPSEYIPASIAPTSGIGNNVTLGTYSVQADNSPYPLLGPVPISFRTENYPTTDVVDRWWVWKSGGVTADVTLTYLNNEKATLFDPSAELGISQWNGTGWTLPTGTATANTVTIKNARPSAPWTICSKGANISYHLALFNAEQFDDMVSLKWTTASENNSDNFIVERSTDGVQFENIGTVKAAGMSSSPLNYSWVDRNPVKGIAYYRLKQIDNAGKSSSSETVKVVFNNSKPGNIEIENFGPNPFANSFRVNYNITKDGPVRFQFVNTKGEVLHSSEVNNEKGSHRFEYNEGAALSQGIYFLKIMYGDKVVTQKFIKK